MTAQTELGLVASLWRYPVKSMLGEELHAAEVTEYGLVGDRAYALVDVADGKAATAKNPRKWPHLFDFRATVIDPAQAGRQPAPIRITLPDGTTVTSDQDDRHEILSRALAREVTLEAVRRGHDEATAAGSDLSTVSSEEYWPDMEGLDFRDTVTDFVRPAGTFFDCAVVHLLTTATLDRLGELYPAGRFDVRRFRPNIVVRPAPGAHGFVENTWVNHSLAIGDEVRLAITGPCARCVMTTLPQADLPRDPGILRSAAQHNRVQVGVYAAVAQGGVIRGGDSVRWGG